MCERRLIDIEQKRTDAIREAIGIPKKESRKENEKQETDHGCSNGCRNDTHERGGKHPAICGSAEAGSREEVSSGAGIEVFAI